MNIDIVCVSLRWLLPGNNWVHSNAPIIFSMMNISVTNSAIQNLDSYISNTILSATNYKVVSFNFKKKKVLVEYSIWKFDYYLLLKVYGVILPEESWAAQPETVWVWFGVVWAMDMSEKQLKYEWNVMKAKGLLVGIGLKPSHL